MKLKLRTLLTLALAVISGIFLIYTSQAVQRAENNLRDAEHKHAKVKEMLHVLTAEWAFLSAPSRLEELANAHLNLRPANAKVINESILNAPPSGEIQDATYREGSL